MALTLLSVSHILLGLLLAYSAQTAAQLTTLCCMSLMLPAAYAHPGTERRRAAVDAVAREAGATANQVVLAWLLGGSPAITPIVGVSSVAQLDEVMAARDVRLSAEQRNLLDSVS